MCKCAGKYVCYMSRGQLGTHMLVHLGVHMYSECGGRSKSVCPYGTCTSVRVCVQAGA